MLKPINKIEFLSLGKIVKGKLNKDWINKKKRKKGDSTKKIS
jgi:hypothetical protein